MKNTTKKSKVEQLHEILLNAFTLHNDGDGYDEPKKYYTIAEGINSEVEDIILDSDLHGFSSEDYHYEWTNAAFDVLAYDIKDLATLKEAKELIENFEFSIESDVYTLDLANWLASRNDRIHYLTQALEESGITNGFDALGQAQYLEKSEVYETARKIALKIIDIL